MGMELGKEGENVYKGEFEGRGRQNVKGTEKGSIDVMLKSLFSSQLYARKKDLFLRGAKLYGACMFKIRNIRLH